MGEGGWTGKERGRGNCGQDVIYERSIHFLKSLRQNGLHQKNTELMVHSKSTI